MGTRTGLGNGQASVSKEEIPEHTTRGMRSAIFEQKVSGNTELMHEIQIRISIE